MDRKIRAMAKEQFRDLTMALIIVVKEAVFALVVLLIGRALGWVLQRLSTEGDVTAALTNLISGIGAVLLFLLLVAKDLWEYLKNR